MELNKAVEILHDITWGPVTILIILLIGLFFSVKLKFLQITNIKLWVKDTFGTFVGKKQKESESEKNLSEISPFKAMLNVLCSVTGTGKIVGVPAALLIGGPGALFWMWVAAVFGMMLGFAETVLAVKYRRRDENGKNFGGPFVYIEDGMKCKWLSTVFCVVCPIVAISSGSIAQGSAICSCVKGTFNISNIITAAVMMILTAFVIFGGIKRLTQVSDKAVPLMSLLYILTTLLAIAVNVKKLPDIFSRIFFCAFDFRSIAGGIMGSAGMHAIQYGCSRGLTLSEAGMGTSTFFHAASDAKIPGRQAMWGIFLVFLDTMVICTLTGLTVLTMENISKTADSSMLVSDVFSGVMGNLGRIILCFSVIMFGFTTIIGNAYQGETALKNILGKKSCLFYKILVLLVTFASFSIDATIAWGIYDFFGFLMFFINLICLVYMSKDIISEANSYIKSQKKRSA